MASSQCMLLLGDLKFLHFIIVFISFHFIQWFNQPTINTKQSSFVHIKIFLAWMSFVSIWSVSIISNKYFFSILSDLFGGSFV